MEAVLRRWATPLQQAAPSIISALLVLVVAGLLANLTWALLPRHAPATQIYSNPAPVRMQQIDAGRIADRHLFGTASANPNAQNAPDTTLALTLHGIVAGKRASDSRALIVANGDEEPYAVGAQLPGGAVIRAIYPDRVMLERDGRLEALRLPKDSGSGGTASATPGTYAAALPQPHAPPPLPQNLGQLRQEIANNPARLMDAVRAMPVMDQGKLTGYRIYPSGNPSLFNQMGLKPGDVVTGVNGIPLTDPAQSMRILSSIKTADQVSITLVRNGQTQTQVLQTQNQGEVAQDSGQDGNPRE